MSRSGNRSGGTSIAGLQLESLIGRGGTGEMTVHAQPRTRTAWAGSRGLRRPRSRSRGALAVAQRSYGDPAGGDDLRIMRLVTIRCASPLVVDA